MQELIYLPAAFLFCVGIHYVTRGDSVFSFWQKLVRNKEGDLRFSLAAPLSECLFCMSSFYGVAFYALAVGYQPELALLFAGFGLLFISIAEVLLPGKTSATVAKFYYLACLAAFCALQFDFINSIVFIFCLCGLNKIATSFFALVQSTIEKNETQIENSIDQARAVDHIVKAIKEK